VLWIDVFKMLKNVIYKYMKWGGTTKYINESSRIIEAYNDTPNQGVEDIAPNDASEKENVETLKILKSSKRLEEYEE